MAMAERGEDALAVKQGGGAFWAGAMDDTLDGDGMVEQAIVAGADEDFSPIPP
jgi:hypothetical protein